MNLVDLTGQLTRMSQWRVRQTGRNVGSIKIVRARISCEIQYFLR
jgi:hypothetical protein